jgi:hypothetical protein
LCLSNPVLPKYGKHKFAKMCHESGKIFEYRNVFQTNVCIMFDNSG